MAFVPFSNSVEIVIRFILFNVPVAIVIGGLNGGGISPSNQLTLATAIDTWRKTHLNPLMTSNVAATDVKVYDLTSESSPVITLTATSPVSGSGTGQVPASAANVVTFNTGKRGRSFRGRNYMFGQPASVVNDPDHWTSAHSVQLALAYAALGPAMNGAGFGHVVLSRQANKALRTLGVATPVTSYSISSRIENQRRRLG